VWCQIAAFVMWTFSFAAIQCTVCIGESMTVRTEQA